MFAPTVNAKQPFPANHNNPAQQLQIVIDQFNRQIKVLQARLAQELKFNTFLVQRATQLPKADNKMQFSPPNFDFCYKGRSHQEDKQVLVKQQDSQSSQNENKNVSEKSKKYSVKTNDYLTGKQEMKHKMKIQSNKGVKLQEKQSASEESLHEKNETKNIPKNYGKAILSFIQKNIQKYVYVVKPILQKQKLSVSDLLNHIKKHKKEVNSIHYLKVMWGFENINDPIFKCIRILSHTFMRKYCLSYIFNSRIKNYNTHIKYRRRMLQGIQNPVEFTCIKQF